LLEFPPEQRRARDKVDAGTLHLHDLDDRSELINTIVDRRPLIDVVTAIVALTDFTQTNGATRIIPGSHCRPDLQRQSGSLKDHPNQILLTGPTGTASFSQAMSCIPAPRTTPTSRAQHRIWSGESARMASPDADGFTRYC